MSLQRLIDRLDRDLARRYPGVHEGLAPGASPPLLEQVPAALAPLYAWRNGSESELYGAYSYLSIDGALECRAMMDGLLATRPDWEHRGWWRKDWFPFLDDRAGNLLCLDLGAAFAGTPHQIIQFDHEVAPSVAFVGIERWIEIMLELIAKKCLLGENEAFEKIHRKMNPGFPHRGSPEVQLLKDEIDDLYNAEKYEKMLARVDKALALAPADPELHHSRWSCLQLLDRDEEALISMIRELELARPTEPPGYRTHQWMAECLIRLERFEEAAAAASVYVSLVEAQPSPQPSDLVEAYRALGDALRLQGRLDDARAAYARGRAAERSAKDDPEDG